MLVFALDTDKSSALQIDETTSIRTCVQRHLHPAIFWSEGFMLFG